MNTNKNIKIKFIGEFKNRIISFNPDFVDGFANCTNCGNKKTVRVFTVDGDSFETDLKSVQKIIDWFKIKNGAISCPEKSVK